MDTWTMSKFIYSNVLLLVLLKILNCEVYNNRPKIRTSNGDLILESAYDKNIYLKPNGPKSRIFYGESNLLNIYNSSKHEQDVLSSDDLPTDTIQQSNLLRRMERLESLTASIPNNLNLNITNLIRKVNNLSNRVRVIQTLLNSRQKDECISHPCENGGTCLNLVNGFYCLCPSNWKGAKCDEDVNECHNYAGTDLGCQNGATCINRPGSYECICKPGWYGLDCTRTAKNCSEGDYEMCGHGICVPTNSGEGIKCICNQGWTTDGTSVVCLTDINECLSGRGVHCSVNPRVNCINLPGSFQCGQCPQGYEGDGFSCYDIDECLTLTNGGCSTSPMVTCHNTIGSRICGPCPPGYQGDGIVCTWRGSCSINRGGCHPSAQCVDSRTFGQGAQCICPYGMEGDGIGLHGCYITSDNTTQMCESNPCGTHGYCHTLRHGYTCICYPGYTGAHCTNPNDLCSNNPCHNGGTCRLDERSLRGYRCECTALYSGELCQVHSQPCGGFLDAEDGSISYPLSNITYRHNSRCAWVIHTAPDKVINVTFTKFNLEYDPECHYDFLQIHDGSSSASQLIGRFCGNNAPNGGNIVSSHNNLYFWFRSDQSVAKEGFTLHWTSVSPVCGGEINATIHGQIVSPGSPGKYPPNRDCYWHLTTKLGKRIQLHFFQLDIEKHSNCSFDYLAIYDGERTTDPVINKYCNSTQPAPIQSASSELLIHFHSDAYGSGKGFQIVFAPVEGVPGCGGFFSTDRGEIVSPVYNGLYLNNLLCEYKIKTSPETRIRIMFKSFNLEKSLQCRYDYLKVYDGSSSDSPLVGKFCGTTYPKTYTSSSNSIFIIFKSDHSMASEGFKLSYESICFHTLIGDSGIIKSPNYPLFYPKLTVCEYVISTSPGKIIQLTFQDFDIEDSRYYNCSSDYVEIRDGHYVNSTLLGKYCGGSDATPPMQISSYNYMYIKLISDMSLTGRGFYANYTTVDVECGGIYRENSGVINYPTADKEQYSNDQTCIWLLIAPEGMHIKITWNRFDVEKMPSCGSDYVELFEIEEDNNKNTIGKYCGEYLPPALTTSSYSLMIKFSSDFSIRRAGFSLSYSFLDEKAHCGGMVVKSHGYIYSPNWPQNYEPNRDCIWTISVPVGRQIVLNITDFDLERPLRDKCDLGDYLLIRDGSSLSSPLIGQYCGSFKTKRIVSTSNNLYLKFHSDFYLSGKGFKIEWDGSLSGCGGTLTSVYGSISSPNYPEEYNENAECFYRIVTSSGSRIRISFSELDLEKTKDCKDDYVEIFDGRNEQSSSYGKHCFMTPKLNNIETSTNYAFIKFRSDIYISAKGFLLNYNTICNNNISGSYGIIESPGYPAKYPLNSNCLWTITVPKGNLINVTFTHFDLSSSFNPYSVPPNIGIYNSFMYRWNNQRHSYGHCVDYLQTKEITDKNFSDRQCGTSMPKPINTKSNSLQIKFISGGFFPRGGFRLEWLSYGCGGHIQKRYGSLSMEKTSSSDSELECEWVIETPVGTAVSITISDFYLAESKNCSIDAIELYNGPSVISPLLTKICHKGVVTIQASSNYLLVRLVKQSSLRNVYFMSNFASLRTGCGGIIKSKYGLIHSNNYPKNYDNNMDCLWSIEVPKNHRIELNFIDFDLYSNYEDEEDCADSIRIYEGSDILHSNYTWLLCPTTNLSQITTNQSSIMVQFITDSYDTAKGFKANFSMICGATIEAKYDGTISNDKFLNHMHENCTWSIRAPDLNKKIALTIEHMSLPKTADIVTNRHCPSSYLRIFDGIDESSPLINELCGSKVPPTIVSHGNTLTVQFGSYTNIKDGYFLAHYSTLINTCGGTFTSEEGAIASPNFPMSYPNSADCEWNLRTSPGNKVYITFESFDLDYSDGCNEDYLEIRENNGGGEILGVYCGQEIPTNTTTGTNLYIKFHSNNQNAGRGFLFHYGFLHGNEIIGLHNGEISSPLYPFSYQGQGEYNWRIMVGTAITISISIDRLEIHKVNDTCTNKLIIYDGYDEEAPVLDDLCGLVISGNKLLLSTSNVVLVKLILDNTNTGSLFHLVWAESNKNIEEADATNKINCGTNETQLVSVENGFQFSSPNYPNSYDSNLHCVWLFQAVTGHHLSLSFSEILLEETSGCYDYISVYSSNTLTKWTPLKEKICLLEDAKQELDSTEYMKVIFKSDSNIERKGFQASVRSRCGGFLEKTSGLIELTWLDYQSASSHSKLRCNWTVKVRPGRSIKIKFEHFNITNTNDCVTYVILKNGENIDSPFLGNGKYCGYSHENRSDFITSSNIMFISFVTFKSMTPSSHTSKFQNFKLRYEEKNIECGVTSTLDFEHKWEIIHSPNYPSVPAPYTECIWVFRGPPGEILRIDFLDRFDLDPSDQCLSESLEIRDGFSQLSPLKGRLCKERPLPSTIKTTDNTMFIKYTTQIAEPRDGFKANISIHVCGGKITAESGEVLSPGYPHMLVLNAGTVCEWEIISLPKHIIKLNFKEVDLPESEEECQTKITVAEKIPTNGTIVETILEQICNELDGSIHIVETLTNKVTIKLHYGKPSEWEQISERRGFKLIFNSSRPSCGGSITASEGYLTTPGYPRETTLRFCQWMITVPNVNRRIRLELIDFNESHNFNAYNDLLFNSIIKGSKDKNSTKTVFESSQNKLTFYVWLLPGKGTARFKAKFSSNEQSLCGGSLNGIQGELESPDLPISYFCEWQYNKESDSFNTTDEFNTISLTVNISSETEGSFCRFLDSKLNIKSDVGIAGITFSRSICGIKEIMYRIPASNMHLAVTQFKNKPINFRLKWKLRPCGGVIHIGQDATNVLNIPERNDDDIDCAWALIAPEGLRVEFKLEGSFNLDCEDEFIQIKSGLTETSVIGDYCKGKVPEHTLVSSFKYPYVQYHSKLQNKTNIKLFTKTVTHQCGGYLTKYDRTFTSPNYPRNYPDSQECTWEIQAEIGYRISLKFVERFVVEDTVNCTKDVIIIYDWRENNYVELVKLCGRRLPTDYNSTSNRMKILFRTDDNINLDGFKAKWNPICSSNLTAKSKEQYLYSPGYTNQYYPSLDCNYEITAVSNKILVKFLDFELEGPFPECKYDNLTLMAQNEYNSFTGLYCGKKLPPPLTAYENVKIAFKTDRFGQRKGFMISYSIYSCGGHVTEPTLLKMSEIDEMEETYSENSNCTWTIEAPIGKQVVLKFIYIDVESSYECYSDYIAVFEGPIIDSDKRLALLCGRFNTTTVIKSRSNKMTLQFISDSFISYKGFEAKVYFTYSGSVGCGGEINLTSTSSYRLRSPLIGENVVYENYLDCHWIIRAPIDHIIKVSFTSFHIAPCVNANQTALGFSKCDCDLVELKDGLNPNSLTIGTYCGHTKPPNLFSSTDVLSIALLTDGEATSSGFEALLSVQPSPCGQRVFSVSYTLQRLRSPGYETGLIPRGLHCSYLIESISEPYSVIHLRVHDIDLEAGVGNNCNKDKLVISGNAHVQNSSLGKAFIANEVDDFFNRAYYFDSTVKFPTRIELCGLKKSLDYYISSRAMLNLFTTVESETNHRGIEIEISYVSFCGRNYTDLQGRIQTAYQSGSDSENKDCYTLITVPENYTISAYFLSVSPVYWVENVYLDIFDGNNTKTPLITKIQSEYTDSLYIFTHGRYLLLHNHGVESDMVTFDLNYIATNKGRGCGGQLHNEIGRVTSPMYPEIYRKKSTCQWELETPQNTRLYLKFSVFDLGIICDQNYVSLINRRGEIISNYCSETPAEYTSYDNYVKIVFTTTNNNGGTGWVADFYGIL